MAFIYSPDKIDALNVSNPKVNRILNCIAISAISSFLKFPLSFHFKYIFVCTICIFFCALLLTHFFVTNNVKSEFIFIDSDTLLHKLHSHFTYSFFFFANGEIISLLILFICE